MLRPSINSEKKRILSFSTYSLPNSSDPMDFDSTAHHFAFPSLYIKLISREINSGYLSTLAKSWSAENNFTTWIFNLNSDLSYSNGDIISIDDVILNLNRIAYLQKIKKSQSGLLEHINGFNNEFTIQSGVHGIRKSKNNTLILTFSKPIPNLLDLISFGFYAIAHPDLFNHQTGEWRTSQQHISSGPYEIKEWTKEFFKISLRDNIPYIDYSKSVSEVHFSNSVNIKEKKDLDQIDMFAANDKSLLIDERFDFITLERNFKIAYLEVYAWKKGHSLDNINTRKWLRKLFYEEIKKHDINITNSFFPTSLHGVTPFPLSFEAKKPDNYPKILKTHPIQFQGKLKEFQDKKSLGEILQKGFEAIGNEVSITQDYQDNYLNYDFSINGTGIEASKYIDTVRFMFLSKEGILLPDENGIIYNELEKHSPDINLINQELWEQAIIWPIMHYSDGYWIKKSSMIDVSQFNTNSPSIDFQFIKWKK